jgi:hypothetical protein
MTESERSALGWKDAAAARYPHTMAPAGKGPGPPARPTVFRPAGAAFGIEDLITLMRSLRDNNENDALIMGVVKKTLESVNVQIPDVINAATERQCTIKERIAALEAHIVAFHARIRANRDEIVARNADYEETAHVKARLELGLNVDTDQASLVRIMLARKRLARRHDPPDNERHDRSVTPRKTRR